MKRVREANTYAGNLVPDYVTQGIDPRCTCGCKGGHSHDSRVRCATCPACGERIQGIWFVEHREQCLWEKRQSAGPVPKKGQIELF